MVLLETTVKRTEEVKREINPVGVSKPAWIIREVLSDYDEKRRYSEDRDDGWEQKAEWFYILHSKEDLNGKLKEILSIRQNEGWKVDNDSVRYHNGRRLTNYVGSNVIELKYDWSEEQVIEE